MLPEQYLKQREIVAGYIRWAGVLATAGTLIVLYPTVIARVLFRVWAVSACIAILWLTYAVLVARVRRGMTLFSGAKTPRGSGD
jgi:hypothetical protein